MYQVSLEEARNHMIELFEAAIRGDEVFIVKNAKQQIRLTPVFANKKRPVFGCAKGAFIMADDFDAPLDDFNEYRV
ncbi:MAG: DUF2281 domain-containing protein [Candidatus Omnitrophota bacterium]|jgi:antitoxin (DNA-binding transcriptional repressor) of toxin-antitoxin stability system|nr:MAG: DUF2281 domain-containing protein [Candidatus Omnitrophota bacterium]